MSLLPSSVPSSLYCELNGDVGPVVRGSGGGGGGGATGSVWSSGISGLTIETIGAIDAVCRCRLGRIGAILEHSGVYFHNPDWDLFNSTFDSAKYVSAADLGVRGSLVKAASGWREAELNDRPVVFYCRPDYVFYWTLLLGFRAVYGGSPGSAELHGLWRLQNGVTSGDFGNPGSAAWQSYWTRFLISGVDCLGALSTAEDSTANKCGSQDEYGSVPFLPGVSVGLDIGQFFRGLDLPGVLYGPAGAAAGDSIIDVNDTDGRVREYLWAFASSRRRGDPGNSSAGKSGCVPGYWWSSSYGFCVNRTVFDRTGAGDSPTLAGNGLYSKTIPSGGDVTVRAWPDSFLSSSVFSVSYWGKNPGTTPPKPSDDLYEYGVETFALFMRQISYGIDVGDDVWSVDGVYNAGLDGDSFFSIPGTTGTNTTGTSSSSSTGTYGTECVWSYVSGETRVGPDAEVANVSAASAGGCSGSNPGSNKPGCPGVGTGVRVLTGANTAGTVYGYCCVGQTATVNPSTGYSCDGGQCGQCDKGRPAVRGNGWISCGATGSVSECASGGGNEHDPGPGVTGFVCFNEVWRGTDYEGTCYHGDHSKGTMVDGNPACAVVTETCTGTASGSTIHVVNWVGGVHSPVVGHPVLRGLAPRGLYSGTSGTGRLPGGVSGSDVISTTCGTRSAPYYFDSTPFNTCLAFYPRPATSSIFVRSSGVLDNGDYRRSYVDPGYSGYFSRFTGSDFSGGQSTGGTTDSESTTTFFPFWAPRAGFSTGYDSGRTVFESSGAMYGHFFDAPTSDDIGVWCSTTTTTSAPPAYCDLTWPSIDTPGNTGGGVIGEVEFSRGMLSQSDLVSLRLSVDRDETGVVGVNGGGSGDSGVRAVSFGGTTVDWYNAVRNRWPGAASDWLDYYYWESVDLDETGVGDLRSSSSSSSSSSGGTTTTDPGTLNVLYGLMTGGGPGLPLRRPSSTSSSGVVVQTFPDFVGGVILGSDGSTTTSAAAAAAGFYSGVNRSGCSEYDGTDYCWAGCRGWRRAAGVPFWMWGRWCGDRTTTVR